jgi:hypothetical protein
MPLLLLLLWLLRLRWLLLHRLLLLLLRGLFCCFSFRFCCICCFACTDALHAPATGQQG